MKNFFIGIILIIVSVVMVWYYLPQNLKDKASVFMDMAARRNPREIKNYIGDKVWPEDPIERRVVLTRELKKNLMEIRKRAEKNPENAASEFVTAAEKLVEELEKTNTDKTVVGELTDRILKTVLPTRPEPSICSK